MLNRKDTQHLNEKRKKKKLQKKKEGRNSRASIPCLPQGFLACPEFIDTSMSFCVPKAQLWCGAGSAAMPAQ